MINIDDARNTLSLGNKYIIMPSIRLRHIYFDKMGAKKWKMDLLTKVILIQKH